MTGFGHISIDERETKPDYAYLRVLLRLAGFDVDLYSTIQYYDYLKCYYEPNAQHPAVHGKLTNRWIAWKSEFSTSCFLILTHPCEDHVGVYLKNGWREI